MEDAPTFYVLVNGHQQGPYTESELRGRIATGSMSEDTLVWREGLQEWTQFASYFGASAISVPPPLPNLQAPQPATQSTSAQNSIRYAKWPWITFAICCFMWLSFSGWVPEIEDEARPYIAEYERMNTTDYQVGTGIEAFFRGALGDPFGKANEEYNKASHIENTLAQLSSDYESATAGRGFFGFLSLVFGGLWIWKHVQFKKRKMKQMG